MPRDKDVAGLDKRGFVGSVFCAMAFASACAALGVSAWGSELSLDAMTARQVSTGFVLVALFDVAALLCLQGLFRWLDRIGEANNGSRRFKARR